MKVKVLTTFKDRHTKEWHKKDDVIEVTEERYNEILTKGKLVELVKEPEEPKPEEPKPEEPKPEEPKPSRSKNKN